MRRVGFFIPEAFRSLRRNAAPSVAATVTIIVTVILLGVLIPVLFATQSKNQEVRDQIALKVFLFDDASRAEIDRLEGQINQIPHVAGTEFVSKAQALAITKERLNDDSDILAELPGNPLPRSFNITLDDPDNLEAVSASLAPIGNGGTPQPFSPIIDEVGDSREEARSIRAVTGALTIVLGVITGLLVLASLLLIANTIRLSIYSRRRDIEVMRLVGATNWFIRWPFVIEGLLVGMGGALAAVAVLLLGKITIVDPLASEFALVEAQQGSVAFLPLVIVLVASAMAVSAIGSGITLRRFLRV